MERRHEEAVARQEAMVDELRKAELVRDRLESLDQSAKAYPEGHHVRVLVEGLGVEQTLRTVEEEVRTLRDSLLYPRGT
jgi:hypothetical protein